MKNRKFKMSSGTGNPDSSVVATCRNGWCELLLHTSQVWFCTCAYSVRSNPPGIVLSVNCYATLPSKYLLSWLPHTPHGSCICEGGKKSAVPQEMVSILCWGNFRKWHKSKYSSVRASIISNWIWIPAVHIRIWRSSVHTTSIVGLDHLSKL